MRSALAEVAKHSETLKFKRENPDSAYKNVKSKLAGNFKSIEKAKKREKQNKQAEANPNPVEASIQAMSAKKLATASPKKSPLKRKMEDAAGLRIKRI